MTDIAIGIIITFLLVCIALLFCAILIKVYVAKIKKYNHLLLEKQREQQQAVNLAVLETQEETLNNIALELHDDAGQRLTYLNLQVEQIKLQQPQLLKQLNPVSVTIKDLAANLRELSHSLTSSSLTEVSLFEVMDKELNRVNNLNIVSCKLDVDKTLLYKFTLEEKIIHYRMFQEIINNMMKHSQATQFTATITKPAAPVFKYYDNGTGFKKSATSQSSGLRNLESRAALIDYDFQLETQADSGTTITFKNN